jgi:hypothetical protein
LNLKWRNLPEEFLMKRSLGILFLLGALLAVPASAGLLYSNGAATLTTVPPSSGGGGVGSSFEISGNLLGSNYWLADTFTLAGASTPSSVQVAIWFPTGSTVTTLDYNIFAIGSCSATPDPQCTNPPVESNTGVSLSNAVLVGTSGSYTLDNFTFQLKRQAYSGGSYWLQLTNVVLNSGNAYWDQNNGAGCTGDGVGGSPGNGCPSGAIWSAAENPIATKGISDGNHSEAFQIFDQTPEPATMILTGAGLLLCAAFRRRK